MYIYRIISFYLYELPIIKSLGRFIAKAISATAETDLSGQLNELKERCGKISNQLTPLIGSR